MKHLGFIPIVYAVAVILVMSFCSGCTTLSKTAGRAELGDIKANLFDIHKRLGSGSPSPDDVKAADIDATDAIPKVDKVNAVLTKFQSFWDDFNDAWFGPKAHRLFWTLVVIGIAWAVAVLVFRAMANSVGLSLPIRGAFNSLWHLFTLFIPFLHNLFQKFAGWFGRKAIAPVARVAGNLAAKAAPVVSIVDPNSDVPSLAVA